MFSMIRQVLGSHSYVDHCTHQAALLAHGCLQPLELSQQVHIGLRDRMMHRSLRAPLDDIIHACDWSHLSPMIDHLSNLIRSSPPAPIDPDALVPITFQSTHQCPECDFATDSYPNLKRHCTNIHGHALTDSHNVNPLDHTIGGMPTCRHCQKSFPTWTNFRRHLHIGACQAIVPARRLHMADLDADLQQALLQDTNLSPGHLVFLSQSPLVSASFVMLLHNRGMPFRRTEKFAHGSNPSAVFVGPTRRGSKTSRRICYNITRT
eukprot:Skav229393  [mRNA]  locus=scaffold904:43402:44193:- [translate_table: standard]